MYRNEIMGGENIQRTERLIACGARGTARGSLKREVPLPPLGETAGNCIAGEGAICAVRVGPGLRGGVGAEYRALRALAVAVGVLLRGEPSKVMRSASSSSSANMRAKTVAPAVRGVERDRRR
jgi:hypothetical protein